MPYPPDHVRSASLATRLTALIGDAECRPLDVPGMTIYRHTEPTEAFASTYQPSIALVAQGRKQVDLGNQQLIYDASHYLLTSLELPVTSRVIEASPARPYLCVRLLLDMGMVRDLLGHDGVTVIGGDNSALAMTTAATSGPLLDAFCRLVDLQHTPSDIGYLSQLLTREILYRVLCSPAGARLRSLVVSGEHSYKLAAVVGWIRENYARPLRLAELAEISAMGESTLHRRFRSLTAMTPLQYQKGLRLQAARQLMLAKGLDAASAAFEVGYESASQFNREYSRFFGRPPMRDIKAIDVRR